MKIIQKILSHGLLIAFFVAVFFIYLYRGELFPQWFDKQAHTEGVPSQTTTTQRADTGVQESRLARTSGTEDKGQTAETVVAEPVAEAIEQAAATDEQAEATERLPGAAPEAASAPAQREAPTVDAPDTAQRPEPAAPTADVAAAAQYRPVAAEEAQKQTYNPVGEVPESVVTAPQYRPLKAKKAAPPDPTAASDRPAAGAAAEADFRSQLEQARQHYWRRDLRAAEQAYRRLTESHPQRAEVWGELGNLYFSQREMVQATDVYYRAIELLIEQGNDERAREMLGAMYQLDADKAKQLEARLARGDS
jgi:hypothetical protein